MKKLPVIIFFINCFVGYSQMLDHPSALKHNIRSVEQQTFFGEDEEPNMTYTEFLNDSGQVKLQTSWSNSLECLTIKKYFFYDNNGKLIKIRSVYFDDNGHDSTVNISENDYNDRGFLKENDFGTIHYKFNKDSLLIEKVEKTAKSFNRITKYYYDSLNRLIEVESYFGKRLISFTEYEYNSKDKLIKKIKSSGEKGSPYSQYEHKYVYDKNGLLKIEYQVQTINRSSDKLNHRTYKYHYTFNN